MAIRIFQGRGIGDRSSFVLRGNAGDKGTVPIGSAPRQSPSLDLSLFFRLFEQALSSWWVPQLCWINRLSSLSSLWAIHVARVPILRVWSSMLGRIWLASLSLVSGNGIEVRHWLFLNAPGFCRWQDFSPSNFPPSGNIAAWNGLHWSQCKKRTATP